LIQGNFTRIFLPPNTYALLVVKEVISSTYREAEIGSESKMWKDAMEEEMSSLHKNDTCELTELPKGNRQLAVSGYMQRKRISQG